MTSFLAAFLLISSGIMRGAGGGEARPPCPREARPPRASSGEAGDGSDWPQFRLDAANRGVRAGDLRIDWEVRVPMRVQSTPVIARGRVLFGSHGDGVVYALDLKTGRCLWTQQLPNWVHNDVVVDSTSAYVGFGNRYAHPPVPGERRYTGMGKAGVAKLALRDGRVIWMHEVKYSHMVSPVLIGNRLIVVGSNGLIESLDTTAGQSVWRNATELHIDMASPRYDRRMVAIGGDPATVAALSADDGHMLWRTRLSASDQGTGTVAPAMDDRFVFTTGTRVLAGRALLARGRLREAFDAFFERLGRAWNDDRTQSQHAYALRRSDGAEIWRRELGAGKGVIENMSGTPVGDERRWPKCDSPNP